MNATPSRRQIAKTALALLPFSSALAAINSRIDGVRLGVQSYSFRDLPIDDAIKAMAADGLGECELFSPHIEAGGIESLKKLYEGGASMTPEERKKAFADAETKLSEWRRAVPLSYFHGVKKKFNDAGIELYGYNLSFSDKIAADEIDHCFQQAKALGVGLVTTSSKVPVAQKMAPIAEKHGLLLAVHGHSNVKDPDEFATPESFAKALTFGKNMRINLDIGHFTAAGYDPVDYISKNHEKIVLLHLKDRKKNDGPNTAWGQGDTPIKEVLQLLKKNKYYTMRAFIEYEYKGAGTSQEEVAKCYAYAQQALA
jgi:sugar phosphate isomerase/epimerase